MRAEFYRPDAPARVVGQASWNGSGVEFSADDADAVRTLERIFRRSAVAVDDSALRTAGTGGPVVLQPGGLLWFIQAARERAGTEGLAVKFVPEATGAMGWDPAAAYRTFTQSIDRSERLSRAPGS